MGERRCGRRCHRRRVVEIGLEERAERAKLQVKGSMDMRLQVLNGGEVDGEPIEESVVKTKNGNKYRGKSPFRVEESKMNVKDGREWNS